MSRSDSWRVERFDLTSGIATLDGVVTGPLVSSDGVRAMAAESPATALVTVDDTLVRARFAGAGVPAAVLNDGLAEPWGIVLAPAFGAVLMSLSTVIVAVNAQLLRQQERDMATIRP